MDEQNMPQELDFVENLGDIKAAEENIPEPIKPPQTDKDFVAKLEEDKGPTRQRIVYFLLAIMVGLISLPFIMTCLQILACKDATNECKDIMTKELWEFVHIAFPALTGLLGTAIGFYFERNSK
jgi:hypothetical protein